MKRIKIRTKTAQISIKYMKGILENIKVYKIYPEDAELPECLDLIYEWSKGETVLCVPVKVWQIIKRGIKRPLVVHTYEGSRVLYPMK